MIQSSLGPLRERIRAEIAPIYVGPDHILDLLLVALLSPGHLLLEGVPGVAKTTLAKAFAQILGCDFRRVQFTPDLLPADITGSYILNLKEQRFLLRRGPIFAHVVLGDEINRAPAKTQSALLEAMQERQVTIEGQTLPLPEPFLVLATQNPIEQEGVYPLPEAQVDRFLMKIVMGYPSSKEEQRMLDLHAQLQPSPKAILSPEEIISLRRSVEAVYVAPELKHYMVALSAFTRKEPRLRLGASPRATLGLMRASKAAALLDGRDYVLPDDVRFLAQPVLAHRMILSPEAEMDELDGAFFVERALRSVKYRGPADR